MAKSGGKSQWVAGLALLASAVALFVWVATMQDRSPDRNRAKNGDNTLPENPVIEGPLGEARPGYANVGGVYRPESDLNYADKSRPDVSKPVIDTGLSPPVDPNSNPQTKAVFAALKSRENPERFSSFVQPQPFDAAAYEVDPDAYLSVVEPGRVFQSAEPGPDVRRINAASSLHENVTQGDQIPLVVKAVAGAPVTFTSFNLGHFENQLTSTTVRAAESGEARALFTAAKGTIDDIRILASSPVTSGQVTFVVNVKLPARQASL